MELLKNLADRCRMIAATERATIPDCLSALNNFEADRIDRIVERLRLALAAGEIGRARRVLDHYENEIGEETPLEASGLSDRACSCLYRGGILSVEQLVSTSPQRLYSLNGIRTREYLQCEIAAVIGRLARAPSEKEVQPDSPVQIQEPKQVLSPSDGGESGDHDLREFVKLYLDASFTKDEIEEAIYANRFENVSVGRFLVQREGAGGNPFSLLAFGLLDSQGEPCAIVRKGKSGEVIFFWRDSPEFQQSAPVAWSRAV